MLSHAPSPFVRRPWLALLLLVPAPSIAVLVAMVIPATQGTMLGQATYFLAKVWIVVLPVIWLVAVDRQRLGWQWPVRADLVRGTILGAAISAVIVIAWLLGGAGFIDADMLREQVAANGLDTMAKYIGLAAYLSLVNALMEEYVWRWFVFTRLRARLGSIPSVVLAAAFFTLHHVIALKSQMDWGPTLLASAGVFLGGVIWSVCRERYSTIWTAYVSHLIVDVTVFVIGGIIIFGTVGS